MTRTNILLLSASAIVGLVVMVVLALTTDAFQEAWEWLEANVL